MAHSLANVRITLNSVNFFIRALAKDDAKEQQYDDR